MQRENYGRKKSTQFENTRFEFQILAPTIALRNTIQFFSAWCDKRSLTKNGGFSILDNHTKISKLKKNCRNFTSKMKKKSKKIFENVFEVFEFLKK